jgi:hypothetical protein
VTPLSHSPTAGTDPGAVTVHRRSRLAASVALLVVAALLAPFTVVAAWARAQIESTDRYVRTVAPLAQDPDVQQYVARAVADAVYEQLSLEDVLDEVLPGDLAALQPTLAGTPRGFPTDAAQRFTESELFERLWEEANRTAHRVISGILTGDADALELDGGQLTLDLGDTLRRFQVFLVDSGFELAGSIDLSGVDRTIVLAEGSQLEQIETARSLLGLLEAFSWVVFLATVGAAAGSVLVAVDRSRALMRLGIGFAFAMLLVAVGLSVARRSFLQAITGALPRPVAASFFDAVSSSMRVGFRAVFVVGLLIAALVVIVAQPSFATRWARPVQIAVGALGVLAVLGREAPTGASVLFVLLLTTGTVGLLELARRRRLVTVTPA